MKKYNLGDEELIVMSEEEINDHFKHWVMDLNESVINYGDKLRIWRASAQFYFKLLRDSGHAQVYDFAYVWNDMDSKKVEGEENE